MKCVESRPGGTITSIAYSHAICLPRQNRKLSAEGGARHFDLSMECMLFIAFGTQSFKGPAWTAAMVSSTL